VLRAAVLLALFGSVALNAGLAAAQRIEDADLRVTLAGPSDVARGQSVRYSVTVVNRGPAAARFVTVTDVLPTELTAVSLPRRCAVLPVPLVVCNIGRLAAQRTVVLTIRTTVAPSVSAGTVVTNSVRMTSDTNDPSPGDDVASVSTGVVERVAADLAITMTGPATVAQGGSPTFTASVTNRGPLDAVVNLTDVLPPGVLVSVTPSSRCDLVGLPFGMATLCSLGTVSAGATVTLTIEGVVATCLSVAAGTVVTNIASVTGTPNDVDLADNGARVSFTCTPPTASPTTTAAVAAGPEPSTVVR
jgi:uncharacterized repeat protein (TIGR01451 family)